MNTVALAAGLLAACAPSADSDEAHAQRAESSEGAELSSREQAFIVFNQLNGSLVSKVHNATIRACVMGDGLNASNRETYLTWTRNSILAWIGAIQPASTRTLTTSVTFVCTGQDVTVNFTAATGRSNTTGFTQITIFSNDAVDHVVLHEFGHAFGLGDTYVEGGFSTCQPGQPASVMCHASAIFLSPQPDDINGIQEAYCKLNAPTCKRLAPLTEMSSWCAQPTDQLLLGDFNNDRRADLLCHNKGTGWKSTSLANTSGKFAGTSWTSDMKWCLQADDQLLLGDFNNDGRDDMLCHQKVTGWKSVALANASGAFSGTSWTADLRWCNQSNEQLLLGDFNGDGRKDMLCHNKSSGAKAIARATTTGTFTGTSWSANLGWCLSGDELYVGDFNGDNRDDMLCFTKTTGGFQIWLANSSGTFTGAAVASTWGGWCQFANGRMFVGDFDGNGSDDILCHDYNTGMKLTAHSDRGRTGTIPGVSRLWNMGWCLAPNQLLVGDFHNDTVSDFLCYSQTTGPLAIARQSLP